MIPRTKFMRYYKEISMNRFIKTAIAIALTAAVLPTYAQDTTVTPAERAKIEGVVKDYLIKNPEVIVQSMQEMQKKQYMEAEKTVQATQKTANKFAEPLFHTKNDPMTGNANGKVTVVEFFDYQCPHCVDMAPVIEGIVKANPDVRIIFKEFPIRGPVSEFAARAALAANKQGKYYEFSHALLQSKPPLTQEVVLETAKKVGLNVDQLKKDMSDKSVDEQLKANIKLAQDLKLFGTPAFFIGKTDAKADGSVSYVPGQMDQNQMQSFIDKAK